MDTDRLMQLLPTRRPGRRLRPRRRGPREPRRPTRTQEELAEYLREKGIRSVRQLRAKRQLGEPALWDYIREWGTWAKAQEAAFGKPLPGMEVTRPTSEYLARCVLDLGLWSREQWRSARRMNPAAVPSIYWVGRLFGRYDNLKWTCERLSFARSLENYLALRRRLGRKPTSAECAAHGVDLTATHRVFDDKRDLDDLLERLDGKS